MAQNRPYSVSQYANNVDFIPEFVEGPFDIPFIKPEPYVEVNQWIPFNIAGVTQYKREERGVHFFVHDYYFENIWTRREKYAKMLKQYGVVLTPDYSPFTDWPIMVQRWNHYRKHLIGSWLQSIGCRVYPTVTWTDEKSYEWCFDGEPFRSTVAISSVGMMKSKENRRLFYKGYDKMMEILEPETIILYGVLPEHLDGNIVHVEPFTNRFKEMKKDDKS